MSIRITNYFYFIFIYPIFGFSSYFSNIIYETKSNWEDFMRNETRNDRFVLLEPDEHGYYHFRGFTDNLNYDPYHPESILKIYI